MRTISILSVLVLTIAAACMAPPKELAPEQVQRTIPAPPSRVARAAVAVFAEYGIPIQLADTAMGLVQGQSLTLRGPWNGSVPTTRFDCGKDEAGVDRASMDPVTVTLGILAQPAPTGSAVRLTYTASVTDHIAASMAVSNPLLSGSAQPSRCIPRATFAAELFDKIQALATR